VFYTGATPNQQLIPAAEYLMSKEGGGYKKFYLLGTDYVFPRTANKILRAFLLAKGVPADSIAEEYTPFNHQDYQTIVGKSDGCGRCHGDQQSTAATPQGSQLGDRDSARMSFARGGA
jgi:hypothetical protein